MTQDELEEQIDRAVRGFSAIEGVDEELANRLVGEGYLSYDDLSVIEPDDLMEMGGLTEEQVESIIEQAESKAEEAEAVAQEQRRRQREQAKIEAADAALQAAEAAGLGEESLRAASNAAPAPDLSESAAVEAVESDSAAAGVEEHHGGTSPLGDIVIPGDVVDPDEPNSPP